MKPLRFLIVCLLVAMPVASMAAMLQFPALTGRVVDEAHLLTSSAKGDLEEALAAQEKKTGNQIVVVTVTSLQGVPIEDFGYRLGRYWGIGQKDKNNGVVLLIAPTEKQIRIDVGYGLEGTLTDAISSQIINTIIVPEFKAGAVQEGIMKGTEAIIAVVSGGGIESISHAQTSPINLGIIGVFALIALWLFSQMFLFGFYVAGRLIGIILSLFGFDRFNQYMLTRKNRITPYKKAFLLWLLTPSVRINGRGGSFGGGGFGGGGGFSGGGGSFGGGGSSGRW